MDMGTHTGHSPTSSPSTSTSPMASFAPSPVASSPTLYSPPVDCQDCDKDGPCYDGFVPLLKQQTSPHHRYAKATSDPEAAQRLANLQAEVNRHQQNLVNAMDNHGNLFYERYRTKCSGVDLCKSMKLLQSETTMVTQFTHLAILLSSAQWEVKIFGPVHFQLPFLNLYSVADGAEHKTAIPVNDRLPAVLKERTKRPPVDFAQSDLEQIRLGWQSGILPKEFNEHCVGLEGDDYGKLRPYNQQEMHDRKSIGYAAFVQLLERQIEYYTSLNLFLWSILPPEQSIVHPVRPSNMWRNRKARGFRNHTVDVLPFSLIEQSFGPPGPHAPTFTAWHQRLTESKVRTLQSMSAIQQESSSARSRIEDVLPVLRQARSDFSDSRCWQIMAQMMWMPEQGCLRALDIPLDLVSYLSQVVANNEPEEPLPVVRDLVAHLRLVIDDALIALCRGRDSVLGQCLSSMYGDTLLKINNTLPAGYNDWGELLRGGLRALDLLKLLQFLTQGDDRDLGWMSPKLAITICAEILGRKPQCTLPLVISEVLHTIAEVCALSSDLNLYATRMIDAELENACSGKAAINGSPIDADATDLEQSRKLVAIKEWNPADLRACGESLKAFHSGDQSFSLTQDATAEQLEQAMSTLTSFCASTVDGTTCTDAARLVSEQHPMDSFAAVSEEPSPSAIVTGEDTPISCHGVFSQPNHESSVTEHSKSDDTSTAASGLTFHVDDDGEIHETSLDLCRGKAEMSDDITGLTSLPLPTTPSEPLPRPQRRMKTLIITNGTRSSATRTPTPTLDDQATPAADVQDEIDESWLTDKKSNPSKAPKSFAPDKDNGIPAVLFSTGRKDIIVPVSARSRAILLQVFEAVGKLDFTDFDRALLDAGLHYGSGHPDSHVTYVRDPTDELPRATITFARPHDGEVGRVMMTVLRKGLYESFGWTAESFVDRRSIA